MKCRGEFHRACLALASLLLIGAPACNNSSFLEGPPEVDPSQDMAEAAPVLVATSPTRVNGVAGDALSTDRVVKATRRGAPVAGLRVSFTVVSGGGSTTPASVETGADGTAATRWSLGFGGKG